MDLTISIVSWNTRNLLDQCLKSVYETTHGIDFEVIVVDNGSSDGTQEMVRTQHKRVTLIESGSNVGFAAANNQAYKAGEGDFFLLLNPDTVCHDNSLGRLVNFLVEHPAAAAVGPLVLNGDTSLQLSWARFPTVTSEVLGKLDRRVAGVRCKFDDPEEIRSAGAFRVDWVGGCCLLARRSVIEQIGLMDAGFFMYCEETDWCYRMHQAGWEIWLEPNACITHLGGQSSAQASEVCVNHLRQSKVRYFRKHKGAVPAFVLSKLLLAKKRLVQSRGRLGL